MSIACLSDSGRARRRACAGDRRYRCKFHAGSHRSGSVYAKDAGADASLSVVPYYNKPTQEGLYQHFRAIAEAVDIPQILYNVPGRTVADFANDTVLRLAQVPNIVGIKDATGDMGRGFDLLCAGSGGFFGL